MASLLASLCLALLAPLLLSACGGEGEGRPDAADLPERRGASLVVGTSMERYGLLVVPRDGGPATLRALEAPGDSLWSGRAALPAAADARALGAHAVLLDAEGVVRRYDPDRDALVEVGRVGPEAEWTAAGRRGLYWSGDGVLEVGPDASWTWNPSPTVRWAGPAAGGRVVALADAGDGRSLLLYPRDAGEPEDDVPADGSRPALVTAWGTRVVLRASGAPELRVRAVPGLESTASWPLPGSPTALAASPSSHRLYVGLEDGRILAIRRFDGHVERLAELDGPVVELRPALFGGGLLASTGGSVWYLAGEDEEPARLPARWRADLPLALPGDRVLVVRDGEVALWSPEEPAARRLEAAADAWWLPVEWRPARGPALAALPGTGAAAEPPPGEERRAAGEQAPPEQAAPEGAAPGEDEEVVDAPEAGGEEERVAPPPADREMGVAEPESGYYAIVASSQSRAGVAALVENLGDAGYPALVQRHRDEAAELWYRALVGPYDDRESAEEAARRLRRERGLEAWISEVGPAAPPGETGGGGR